MCVRLVALAQVDGGVGARRSASSLSVHLEFCLMRKDAPVGLVGPVGDCAWLGPGEEGLLRGPRWSRKVLDGGRAQGGREESG